MKSLVKHLSGCANILQKQNCSVALWLTTKLNNKLDYNMIFTHRTTMNSIYCPIIIVIRGYQYQSYHFRFQIRSRIKVKQILRKTRTPKNSSSGIQAHTTSGHVIMRLLIRNQTIQPMKQMLPAMTQANHLMVLQTPWKKMTKIQRHRNSSLGSNQKTTKN